MPTAKNVLLDVASWDAMLQPLVVLMAYVDAIER
jgi:hypothetical protein